MATSGVNMLMQLLQQSQDARQKAAYFDAQQQEAEAQRIAAQQQQNQSLAQQLRGQMLMHAMDDTARQSTDTVNYNRQVAADSAHWARVKEQEAQRNARDDAKWKAYLDAIKPKTESAEKVAEINARGRVEAANAPRVSKHYGYSITERRGDVGRAGGGGGQQSDVRKTQLFNEMNDAKGVYLGLNSAWLKTIDGMSGSPPPRQVTDAEARYLRAQKAFHDAGGVDPAPVVGVGGQPPASVFDPKNPFARRQ